MRRIELHINDLAISVEANLDPRMLEESIAKQFETLFSQQSDNLEHTRLSTLEVRLPVSSDPRIEDRIASSIAQAIRSDLKLPGAQHE